MGSNARDETSPPPLDCVSVCFPLPHHPLLAMFANLLEAGVKAAVKQGVQAAEHHQAHEAAKREGAPLMAL